MKYSVRGYKGVCRGYYEMMLGEWESVKCYCELVLGEYGNIQ